MPGDHADRALDLLSPTPETRQVHAGALDHRRGRGPVHREGDRTRPDERLGDRHLGGVEQVPEDDPVVALLDGFRPDERPRRPADGPPLVVSERVADDGVVTADAVEEAVGETSLAVATAENRSEFAAMALDDAREAVEAEGVADVDAVCARLDRFVDALSTTEDDLAALRADLEDVVDRLDGEGATYAAVRALRAVDRDARAVQRAADELQVDVEDFERRVRNPAAWVAELDGDVDALESAVEDLTVAADGVTGADDPGAVWADARLRTAAYDLLLADLRAELAALRTWPDGTPDGTGAVGDRLADLAARLTAVRERLADDARPAWRERHGDRVEGFERELADRAPPVAWGEVETELADRREVVGDASRARQ